MLSKSETTTLKYLFKISRQSFLSPYSTIHSLKTKETKHKSAITLTMKGISIRLHFIEKFLFSFIIMLSKNPALNKLMFYFSISCLNWILSHTTCSPFSLNEATNLDRINFMPSRLSTLSLPSYLEWVNNTLLR